MGQMELEIQGETYAAFCVGGKMQKWANAGESGKKHGPHGFRPVMGENTSIRSWSCCWRGDTEYCKNMWDNAILLEIQYHII